MPHSFDPTILREYDIRGVVGETLSEADAETLGRAFGTVVRRAGGRKVAVGYDGRVSSPALESALTTGLTESGVEVLRVGRGPTPMLYFAVHHLNADGGVMVTGSHNPPSYNGFKLMLGRNAFFGEDIQNLSALVEAGDLVSGYGGVEAVDIAPAYLDRLVSDIDLPEDMKVAWDAGNGAAGEVLRLLTERLPGEHLLLYDEIDGRFPNHHPDPTVEANLADLKALVRAEDCNLGVAFDGDGDRIGLVDGEGEALWGDQMLLLLARQVLHAQPGAAIIADVKASQTLFDGVAALGGNPVMWKTGHSLIKTKMKELHAPLAGEMSAHLFFADRYYGFDDALYAGLRILEALGQLGVSLADFRRSLPTVVNTPELRFDCPEARKWEVIDEVRRRLEAEGAEVNGIDGVRVKQEEGWWLLRASNTQSVLVARCESDSDSGLRVLYDALSNQLRASGMEPPELSL